MLYRHTTMQICIHLPYLQVNSSKASRRLINHPETQDGGGTPRGRPDRQDYPHSQSAIGIQRTAEGRLLSEVWHEDYKGWSQSLAHVRAQRTHLNTLPNHPPTVHRRRVTFIWFMLLNHRSPESSLDVDYTLSCTRLIA
jgi:hypothetical protein